MMMQMLATFAALSMAGTVLLSLLPEGGIKRTAGMAVGLLTLMCWADGLAALLSIDLSAAALTTVLAPTAVTVEAAAQEASTALSAQWEDAP